MKKAFLGFAMVIFTSLLLAGCGSGGGKSPTITLTADKTEAMADSIDEITVTATVTDGGGSPIGQAEVYFQEAGVIYTNPTPVLTDATGRATTKIHETPLDAGENRNIKMTAKYGGLSSNEISLRFVTPPQNASTIELTADRSSIRPTNRNVSFNIVVKDINGAPLGGQVLSYLFSPDQYYPVGYTPSTDGLGRGLISGIGYRGLGFPAPETITVTVKSGTATSNTVTISVTPD